ncbi:MAG: hypothetical protein IKB02_02440 [Clostridia bacterium]|nr:hypothetical protein [Clostridia bacterium]
MAAIEILSSYWGLQNPTDNKFVPGERGYKDRVDIETLFYNSSEKDIKYITFTYCPYNDVVDIVTDRDGNSTVSKKLTGPIEKDTLAVANFSGIWYDNTISNVIIQEILVEFMDGTSEHLSDKEIVNVFSAYMTRSRGLDGELIESDILNTPEHHRFMKNFFPYSDIYQKKSHPVMSDRFADLIGRFIMIGVTQDFEFNVESLFGERYGEEINYAIDIKRKEIVDQEQKKEAEKAIQAEVEYKNKVITIFKRIGCLIPIAILVYIFIRFIMWASTLG